VVSGQGKAIFTVATDVAKEVARLTPAPADTSLRSPVPAALAQAVQAAAPPLETASDC
jgi:hypothetical protein